MRRRLFDILLWIGATLGVVSLVAAAAVALFGFVPLVFTSGSMSPDIPAGSVGIARSVSAEHLTVGDVVSVERADGARVTHRIVAIDSVQDHQVSLTLKGDANDNPDKERYAVDSADRLLFSVPWVGYVLVALASPIAVFLGGMLVAGVLAYVFLGRKHRGGAPVTGRRAAATTASLVLASVGFSMLAQPSLAAFSDQGTVETAGFVTHRVAQPTSVGCSTNLLAVTVTTPMSDTRYTYWARAFNAGGTAMTNYKQMTGGATRSATFVTTDFLLNVNVGTTYFIRVYARLSGTSWESVDYRSQPFSRTLVLMSCGDANPAATIGFTKPTNGMTGKTDGTNSMQDQVAAVCQDGTFGGTRSAACGTTSDDGSVTDVKYILQRTGGTFGVRCWNGASLWVTDCSFRTANTSADKKKWSVPRLTAITYPYISDGAFTLTIRVTDNSGNVTESSINFTVTY